MEKQYAEKVEETCEKADETVESSLDQAKAMAIDAGETFFGWAAVRPPSMPLCLVRCAVRTVPSHTNTLLNVLSFLRIKYF